MRTVPELEFIPVPQEATAPCTVPMPPLNAEGEIEYTDVPPYAAEVLGILEECNIQLEELREIYREGKVDTDTGSNTHDNTGDIVGR